MAADTEAFPGILPELCFQLWHFPCLACMCRTVSIYFRQKKVQKLHVINKKLLDTYILTWAEEEEEEKEKSPLGLSRVDDHWLLVKCSECSTITNPNGPPERVPVTFSVLSSLPKCFTRFPCSLPRGQVKWMRRASEMFHLACRATPPLASCKKRWDATASNFLFVDRYERMRRVT